MIFLSVKLIEDWEVLLKVMRRMKYLQQAHALPIINM